MQGLNQMQTIEHHIKYKEIHGVDETVWMEVGKHTRLHRRLRREGKCNIPVDEMHQITNKAHSRTEKAKKKHRDDLREYNRKNIKVFCFYTVMEPNIYLTEYLVYNTHTGSISFDSWFQGKHNIKLYNYVESA